MGKRMFFLSLLILSLAMGFQFYKAKPKKPPLQIKRQSVAINLDNLELTTYDKASATMNASGEPMNASEEIASDVVASVTNSASEEQAITEVHTASSADILEDPVIYAFKHLKRNPFEPSPFEKLIAEAQASAAAALAADPLKANKNKPTEILNAPFGGTIETQNALLAIIDKRLYKVGDQFQGKTIRKIEKTHVTLDDAGKIYLLPKTGVQIKLADESITIIDEFLKKTSQ